MTEHSKRPVVVLSRQPKLLLPGVMVALVLAGLAAPVPVAVVALVVVGVFIGWLAYLSWPVLEARHRALRIFMLLVLAGVAVARATGALA